MMPFAATLDVDRTDDTAAASACTAAPNDCSLRGAVINANADAGAMPLTINLQPSTTYNLTLTNAAQENAAATGDLAIDTSLHTVTFVSGVRITKVTSDELENSGGDGSTLNDIMIAADCKSVKLRAERTGGGNGRAYTITFEVSDASGNVGTATAKVTVLHSQNGSAAVDDGPHYTVTGSCP